MHSRAVEAVLADYEARAAAETALMQALTPEEGGRRRDEWLLPIGRAAGQLLTVLITELRARWIVEAGTSYGYSTLWLAAAAQAVGGRVVTFEISPSKAEHARAQIARAGLADVVDFRVGDAVARLAELDAPVDFALIDLWKDLYIPVFDLLHPRLARGAIVAADNMLFPEVHRRDAQAYRRHVRTAAGMSSVLLPVGSGIEISRYAVD